MTPFFSVITPTIQRESLIRCCESLDNQTFTKWQHVLQIDAAEYNSSVISRIKVDKRRRIEKCGVHHSNFGNTCRNLAWIRATGRWVIYLDCDNLFTNYDVLMELAIILQGIEEKWAIIPMFRHGSIFFNNPPGLCMSDTANIVVRREIGRWPDGAEYTMDGIWIEGLKISHPEYAVLSGLTPVITMLSSGLGQP